MDLKTFVAETLTQIVAGVAEARTQIDALGVGAKVNPTVRSRDEVRGHVQEKPVDFDVAVTVVDQDQGEETSKVGGGMAGVLAGVGVKIGAEMTEQANALRRNETVSRVQFEVMLAQPGAVRILGPSPPIPYAENAWRNG